MVGNRDFQIACRIAAHILSIQLDARTKVRFSFMRICEREERR